MVQIGDKVMCEICDAERITICYESEFGKHYGYCGGYNESGIRHFAIKQRTDRPDRGKYNLFKYCPMCGKNLEGE